MTDTQIKVLSVLRRTGEDDFTLIVRWLLGDGDDLPLDDDTFRVRLQLRPSKKVIFKNGAVGDPDGSEWIEVRPRNFAMIDPPRRSVLMGQTPEGDAYYRLVAQEPTAPIDPTAANGGTLRVPGLPDDQPATKPMGVYHLLAEADPTREAWRIADAAAPAMRARLSELRQQTRGFGALTSMAQSGEDPADLSAKALARYLVASGMRPMDLPKIMTDAVALFRAHALAQAAAGAPPTWMPRVFTLDGADIAAQAEHAALITSVLSNQKVLDRIDAERTPRLSARQQLRLRALQGGELIDFWCNADASEPACTPEARGKRYPASELIGLGFRVFEIDRALVEEWASNNTMLQVDIEHTPGGNARPETPFGMAETLGPGNLSVDGAQSTRWDPGKYIVTSRAIKRAVQVGGSELPAPPVAAEINFDLNQSNAGDEQEDRSGLERGQKLTFETGDGKVQILIKGPEPDENGAGTVFSYNLYGVWEGAAGTEALFADPPNDPLPEVLRELLKPYRMTARYSFSRDLLPAFPSPNPHPAVQSALADPPWFPILIRPTAAYEPEPQSDTGDGRPRRGGRPLPIVGRDDMTATSIDLRKGLDFDPADHAGYTVAWDPFGRLKQDWSPETKRDGSPAGDRPQRYRFWVTSVDAFEQESDPVPVRANDADGGEAESFLYAPRYRTPLPPPRGVDDNGPSVAFDEGRGLVVEWRTPLAERLGVDAGPDAPHELLDKRHLKAEVRLYRRRISPLRPRDEALVRMQTATDLPQWRDTAERLREQGYELYRTKTDIGPPDNGEKWSYVFPMLWTDRGYEYVAGIAFGIVDAWKPFWAPNAIKGGSRPGRQAMLQRLVGDAYEADPTRISEVPQVSDVTLSRAYFHANQARPRAVVDVTEEFSLADPILPVLEVQRDAVLLRLLSNPVEDSEPTPWLDTEIALTDGQKAMCEAAIRRVRLLGGGQEDPGALDLADLRRIFAENLRSAMPEGRGRDEPIRKGKVLSQHPTVGFRGIQTLAWRYRPFSLEEPEDGKEAEAALIRVYQVRVPITRIDAQSYATARGIGTQIDGQPAYRLSDISGDAEALSAIATTAAGETSALGQPAAVLIDTPGAERPLIRTARAIDITNPDNPIVTLDNATDIPASATVMLFAAREVAERRVEQFEEVTVDSIRLPVGGGFPEFFIWWLVSVSAQGIEAAHDARATITASFPMTIEPEPPSLLTVMPPTDRTAHTLDPENDDQAKFLPSNIDSVGNALNNPRLLLTWKDPRPRAGAWLVLWRQRQRVDSEETDAATFDAAEDFAGWHACKAIEGLAEDGEITGEQLGALADTWLLGKSLAAPDDTGPAAEDIFIPAERGLSSSKGVKLVAADTAIGDAVVVSEMRPALVDYYFRNGDNKLAMEGSFAYAYSAARAIDLDDLNLHDLPPERRYLLSRRTSWSPFILPATPPFKVVLDNQQPADIPPVPPTGTPEVVFRFTTPQTLQTEISRFDHDIVQFRAWFYRIVVRRRIDNGFASAAGEAYEPQWIEIGEAGKLKYDGTLEIKDTALDRLSPDATISCQYSIGVTQMAEITDSQGTPLGEIMVRRGEKDDGKDHVMEKLVEIPPMRTRARAGAPDELVAERRVVVPVMIV